MSAVRLACLLVVCASLLPGPSGAAEPVKYCRFQVGDDVSYGIVEGQRVRRLQGDLFGEWSKTDDTYPLKDLRLLAPTTPRHVFAMAGNYRSHLSEGAVVTKITTVTTVTSAAPGEAPATETESTSEVRIPGQVPEKFRIPQPFFKSPSSIIGPGRPIVLPADAGEVHFEAEMVIVIGKQCRNVPPEAALDYVLGVTCGNDISARVWQKNDVQWWRAKGCDTFGPCGPFIVSGLNYDDLLMQLRVNGEVKQKERTSQLIHDVPTTVSFISRHVTLEPGDLIFSGTPGETSALKPGDVVEVELEGVGVLRNPVE